MYSRSNGTHSRRSPNKSYSSVYGESKKSITSDTSNYDYYQSRGRKVSGDNRYSDHGATNGYRAGYSPKYSSSPEVFNSSSLSGQYSRSLPQDNSSNYESKLLDHKSRTRLSSASDLLSKPLSRSNSYHDLTKSSRPHETNTKSRRKTLTYGVSQHDLTSAREALTTHRSTDFGASNSSSRSAHVSFLSPPVQSYAELPSFSSTTSSLPYLPSETSDSHYYSKLTSNGYQKKPSSSSTFKSSPSYTSLSLTYPSSSPLRASSSSMKEDSLVLLKKQDINEMLYPRKSSYSHLEKTSWRPSRRLTYMEDKLRVPHDEMDYKKLSLVNDDVMKLWEETEAENRRLLSEMSRVRSELQETRYQMEAVSCKASSINAVSDIEKKEKTLVMKKLSEMEKELKLLAQSENITDQALSQLKSDNSRLREENKSLIRVISKLSGTSYNPTNNSYICKHGRVHSYNNSNTYSNSTSYNNLASFNNLPSYNNTNSYNSAPYNNSNTFNNSNPYF